MERLETCKRLIDEAGLAPREGLTRHSASRLREEEYDEDREESEEETSLGDNPNDCPQCGKELKTKKLDWLDSWQALKLVKIVAGIVLEIRRSKESLLAQLAIELLKLDSHRDVCVNGQEVWLIESMLVKRLEDPPILLRRYLGRHHPLIRAAYQAERPPGIGGSREARCTDGVMVRAVVQFVGSSLTRLAAQAFPDC